MKKTIAYSVFIMLVTAFMLGCSKKVSTDKVKAQIEQALLAEEQEAGNTLVVNDFTLDTKDNGKHYEGVINGTMNDTLEVSYKVTVDDSGNDLDAEWERIQP